MAEFDWSEGRLYMAIRFRKTISDKRRFFSQNLSNFQVKNMLIYIYS